MDTNHILGARMLTPLLFSKLLVITAFSSELAEPRGCLLLSRLLVTCYFACFDDRDCVVPSPFRSLWPRAAVDLFVTTIQLVCLQQ